MGYLRNLIQTWENFGQKVGNTTKSYTDVVHIGIAQKACQIYNLYPDLWQMSPYHRGFFRGVCANANEPLQPPSQAPVGGQCFTNYRLFGEYVFASSRYSDFDCGDIVTWGVSEQIPGKIVAYEFLPGEMKINVTTENESGVRTSRIYFLRYAPNAPNSVTGTAIQYQTGCQNSTNPCGYNPVLTTFKRIDGLPDDCHTTDIVLPPEATQGDLNLGDYYEGDTLVQGDTISYNFDMPVVNNQFNFPLEVNVGGNNWLEIDVGGISFSRNTNEFNYNRRGGGGGGGNGSGYPGDESSKKPPIIEGDEDSPYEEEVLPEEEVADETGLYEIEYVTVLITKFPKNLKRENGSPGADVIYPGFFTWRMGSYNFPRIPLHFVKNILLPPNGADGYTCRLYPGFDAQFVKYTRKK